MNEVMHKYLLAGDNIFNYSGFTHSAYWHCTEYKEQIQKFKETGDSRYIYQRELVKTSFQYNIAYEELLRRIASKKYYPKNHLIILKLQNIMNREKVLVQWFRIFLIKTLEDKFDSGRAIKMKLSQTKN